MTTTIAKLQWAVTATSATVTAFLFLTGHWLLLLGWLVAALESVYVIYWRRRAVRAEAVVHEAARLAHPVANKLSATLPPELTS